MSVQVKGSGTIGGLDEGLVVSGIVTSSTQINVGSNIKIGNAGVITATSFVGSGANLTGVLSNIVEDTSPQLGANLDTNTKCIDFGDSNTGTVNRLRFGASTDFEIFHNGTNNHIDCHTAGQDLYIRPTKDVYIQDYSTDDIFIKMIKDGAVELYHNVSKKIETTNTGAVVTGICTATSFSGSGEGLTRTTQLSHRNLVINGAMIISQRATSSSTVGAGSGYLSLIHISEPTRLLSI